MTRSEYIMEKLSAAPASVLAAASPAAGRMTTAAPSSTNVAPTAPSNAGARAMGGSSGGSGAAQLRAGLGAIQNNTARTLGTSPSPMSPHQQPVAKTTAPAASGPKDYSGSGSFGKAFGQAQKDGGKTFTFNGKSYANEMAKAPAAKTDQRVANPAPMAKMQPAGLSSYPGTQTPGNNLAQPAPAARPSIATNAPTRPAANTSPAWPTTNNNSRTGNVIPAASDTKGYTNAKTTVTGPNQTTTTGMKNGKQVKGTTTGFQGDARAEFNSW